MKRFVVDTDGSDEVAVCRLILRTVAADVHQYETDIPVADPDWPADVAAAAEALRAVGRTDHGYTMSGTIRTPDLWPAFVTFAPYAYDATVWNASQDIVSLSDEAQSIVVRLTPAQHALLGSLRLIPEREWRRRRRP
ncbi:hypothetical protein [Kribbella lupini]|uniref:Uncharacterized protein n=1 Tax=Kribbella lupini TaxID=291602 RepID=A0ABN1ZZD6_9ACTN